MKLDLRDRWRKAQIAEEKAHRAYKEIYNWSTQSWEAVLRKEFSISFKCFTGKRVLEVGCGCLGPIHYINSSCFRVGSDPLLTNYKDLVDTASTTHLVASMAENLPFKDESFDVILCINVLDHVMDPHAAAREIRRVIAPGGLLLLEVYVFNSLPRWLRRRLHLWDRPHPFHFSAAEVILCLKQAGFSVLDYKERAYEHKRGNKVKLGLFDKHALKLLVARLLGIRRLVVRAHTCSQEKLEW
jgi:ubiquinone/menaquinone biosynthesis C-methylase UbiE